MTPDRWHRFKRIVGAVLERERAEWPRSLLAECGDDVDLFLEASSLLALSRSAGEFIEVPAWQRLASPANPRSRPLPG